MNKQRLVFVIVILFALFAPLWAQSESDFAVGLTEDGNGVVIRWYEGKSATVRIPATIQGMPVRVIEKNAFSGPLVTSVVIPVGVTTINESAFSGCRNIQSITIPNTVTRIGSFAFSQTRSLTSINLPANLISIGESAFDGSGITSISWPAGINKIPYESFSGCQNLKSVTIPEGVTTISAYAFNGATGITNITLPSTIEKIEDQAFQDCRSLTTITIPASVTSIQFGNLVFVGCRNLSLATQAVMKKLGYTDGF